MKNPVGRDRFSRPGFAASHHAAGTARSRDREIARSRYSDTAGGKRPTVNPTWGSIAEPRLRWLIPLARRPHDGPGEERHAFRQGAAHIHLAALQRLALRNPSLPDHLRGIALVLRGARVGSDSHILVAGRRLTLQWHCLLLDVNVIPEHRECGCAPSHSCVSRRSPAPESHQVAGVLQFARHRLLGHQLHAAQPLQEGQDAPQSAIDADGRRSTSYDDMRAWRHCQGAAGSRSRSRNVTSAEARSGPPGGAVRRRAGPNGETSVSRAPWGSARAVPGPHGTRMQHGRPLWWRRRADGQALPGEARQTFWSKV